MTQALVPDMARAYRQAITTLPRVSADDGEAYDRYQYHDLQTLRATCPLAAEDLARRGFIGLATIRRPKGRLMYLAGDRGPHPLWGENRRYVRLAHA